MKNKPDAAHIEREIGHNTAVALGQQIIKLEDQLAAEREEREAIEETLDVCGKQLDAAVEALKQILVGREGEPWTREARIADAALAKIEQQPVQLPMINDDPVVTLK